MEDPDDSPNVKKAIEGIAHAFDLAKQAQGEEDPQTRKAAKSMDKITVGEAIEQLGKGLARKAQEKEISEDDVEFDNPLLDIIDIEEGVQVVLDLSQSDVSMDDLEFDSEGRTLIFRDSNSSWEQKYTIEDEYGEIADQSVSVNGQVVTIDFHLEELVGGEDEGEEEEEESEDETESEEEGENEE